MFSFHIKGSHRLILVGVGLNHLAEVVFVTFLPFHTVLLQRKALCTATLNSGGYVPPPVGKTSKKLLWILLMYLLSHLLIWTHQYFILGVTIHTTLFCCSGCSSFVHWELFHWFLCFWHSSSLWVCSVFYFKLSDTTRCSSLILCISYPSLRITISPRSPGSFYCSVLLETKIWVLGVLMLLGVFTSADREQEARVN